MTPLAPLSPSVPTDTHNNNQNNNYPVNNHNHNNSQRFVESSNSTATIFLGGVRRSWMLKAAGSQPPTLTSSTIGRNPSNPEIQPTPSTSSSFAPTAAPVIPSHHQNNPLSPRALPEPTIQSQDTNQHSRGNVVISTTSPSCQLLSSLTTSVEDPLESRIPNNHTPSPPSFAPRTSPFAPTPQSASASPAILSDHHSRPLVNDAQNDICSSGTPATTPLTPASTPTVSRPPNAARADNAISNLPQEHPEKPVNSGSRSLSVAQNPPQSPNSLRQLPQIHSSLPSQQHSPPMVSPERRVSVQSASQRPCPQIPASRLSHTNPPSQPSPCRPAAVEPSVRGPQTQSPHVVERIRDLDITFFRHSLKRLESLSSALTRPVEQSRANLLSQACTERDCMFLAIHQLYCLYSYAPAELSSLPGFARNQVLGLEVLKRILVDNNHLSPSFLKWCIHFPAPLRLLMETPIYRGAVERSLICLAMLTDHWSHYTSHVQTRGFPPLVQELVIHLGVQSEVLAYTIFLSTCRRLPGTHVETNLKKVWIQDLENYRRRRSKASCPISTLQIQQENDRVIQAYRSFTPSDPPTPQANMVMPTRVNGNRVAQAAVPGSTISSPQFPIQLAVQPGTSTAYVVGPPAQAVAVAGSGGPTIRTVNGSSITTGPQFTNSSGPHPLSSHTMPPTTQVSTCHPRSNPVHTPGSRPPRMGTFGTPIPGTPSRHSIASPAFPHQSIVFPSQSLSAGHTSSPAQTPVPAPFTGQLQTHGPQAMVVPNTISRPPPRHMNIVPPVPAPSQLHGSPLLPVRGACPTNIGRPHPIRDSLHQAHLRDPQNRLISRGPAGERETELFQYLTAFMVSPISLGRSKCSYRWQFSLSKAEVDRFPKYRPVSMGSRPLRILSDGCQLYRLRCIRAPPSVEKISDETWSVAETAWPGVIYLFINDVEVFVRRKIHNGKDIPLDITGDLREGINTVSLHFIRNTVELRDQTYALAVETCDIASFSRVKSLVQALPASDSRERICKRLTSSTSNDDDLSIVSEYLTVSLVDPFTARIFNTPVRGRSCGHPECFDHETWISTRASKTGKRPLTEDWRCPICGNDARPQSLIIDGFLAEVRAALEHTNRLEGARTIRIQSDGSWVLKSDAEDQSPSLSSNRQAIEDNQVTTGTKRDRENDIDNSLLSPVPAQKRHKVERSKSGGDIIQNTQPSEVIVLD
ncbi:hypothetical protein FE257_002363 [Aspergillus nanangensis]|uniref:SP-RING-type domain-containing protein n=1 Tax=Aspergillus nanangensis TaxID=2582783 RepID=A0AAD4CCN0_ASPNN|nr:hypothetical protein FE257_002363 [Aspergillus nanangensis]